MGVAKFRGYIFDLDGTVYLSENAIPGAKEVIAELRSQYDMIESSDAERRKKYVEWRRTD